MGSQREAEDAEGDPYGFLVVWLLYPVTSVAVWMPWLFLATDRVFAAITLLALMGTLLFYAIELLEALAIPWHESHRRRPRRASAKPGTLSRRGEATA